MDIDEGSLSKSRKLIKCIQSELKSSNLDVRSGEEADYEVIASSLAEWTYYFLISYKESGSSKDIDNRITEILDVFDEISQLNQKYKVDEDDSVNQESLNDIHDFIEKSVQYIFNKNNVDYAVLEVGLGGRLDATNIIDSDISCLLYTSDAADE